VEAQKQSSRISRRKTGQDEDGARTRWTLHSKYDFLTRCWLVNGMARNGQNGDYQRQKGWFPSGPSGS
jgi:hypothetical protein